MVVKKLQKKRRKAYHPSSKQPTKKKKKKTCYKYQITNMNRGKRAFLEKESGGLSKMMAGLPDFGFRYLRETTWSFLGPSSPAGVCEHLRKASPW